MQQARPRSTQRATDTAVFPGDVNCSGTTDAIDSLQILNFAAGLTTTAADCLQQYGDVNCDASVNVSDSTLVLRYAAELPRDLTQSCPAIGGPPTAEALTRALNTATTPGDADWVLKLVYQELGIAVYTRDGQLVQAGTQAAADDFYFYDFESELLARDYVDGQLYGLDTAALFLNEAGVLNAGGQAMSAADVLSVLTAKVTAARGDDSMFSWRLIDELGLARAEPLDLTKPGLDPATTYLDPLQTFLVLNDMTLGLPVPAGASTEGLSAADAPDARTQALHDYSLLAQAYRFFGASIEPTHWKQGLDEGADRKVQPQLRFEPGDEVAQGVTAGPLQDVALPPAGGVPGAVVDWFPDASLVPQNGTMLGLPSSRTTDSDGYTHDFFIPKTECPATAGVGQVVRELGTLQVVARVPVTSVFPPHNPLGVISKPQKIFIYVSHHVTSPASQAQPGESVSIEAITSLDQLPCAYEGTASSIHHDRGSDTKDVTTTVTATGLRFEMTLAQDGHYYYELAQGTIKVEVSGADTDPDLLCTWSGGSTLTAETPNTPDKSTFGSMQIVPASGYSIVAATADLTNPVQVDCSGPGGVSYRTFYVVQSFIRVPQNVGPNDLEPFSVISDLQTLSGTRDDPVGIFGANSHYEWNLHSAGCGPSPEPICQ